MASIQRRIDRLEKQARPNGSQFAVMSRADHERYTDPATPEVEKRGIADLYGFQHGADLQLIVMGSAVRKAYTKLREGQT